MNNNWRIYDAKKIKTSRNICNFVNNNKIISINNR